MEVLRNFPGLLRIRSKLFKSTKSEKFLDFTERLFSIQGVESIEVDTFLENAKILYHPDLIKGETIIRRIRSNPRRKSKDFTLSSLFRHPTLKEDRIKLTRYSDLVTNWEIVFDTPGRIRLKQVLIHRKRRYCQRIEKALFNTPGVESYRTNSITCKILVVYDEEKITKDEIIKIMDKGLAEVIGRHKRDRPRTDYFLSNTSLGLAALGNFVYPWMMPFNTALVFYTARPTWEGVGRAIKEKKIKVDILDAVVTIACLATGNVFAAALMTWCLSTGANILDKTSEESKKMLTSVFGKQERFAWVFKGKKKKVQVPVESLKVGDTIVVHTGEYIPIDGEVSYGDGMVDQHILTGESAPVEKKKGDKVFASTLLMAGYIYVTVQKTGAETTASKIKEIISHSANYKVRVHSRAERLADKAVLPTLGLASVGYATAGQGAALAIINCDYGTGIRMAAPMGLLSSLTNAARHGVLVKNGQALETLPQIDAFLFDKTGTLTREIPEVREIISVHKDFDERRLLAYTAAAEKRFTHPIARAIWKKAEEKRLRIPKRDESKYHVGFGIEVGINGNLIKVGSPRFMEKERIRIPSIIEKKIREVRHKGGMAILTAINGDLAGVLDLQTSHRPEAYDVIQGLKNRGVKDIVLISGDHEVPTRNLAERLGIERYYAEVLPQDKAEFVKMLKREGRRVAMTGDGINDAPALSLADVSISLRGATDIATDVADIVFMDGDLVKTNLLYDISKNLERNVNRSWGLIVVPNTLCIIGALFGRVGLGISLIMNNGFNFIATMNGMVPMHQYYEEEEKVEAIVWKNEREIINQRV